MEMVLRRKKRQHVQDEHSGIDPEPARKAFASDTGPSGQSSSWHAGGDFGRLPVDLKEYISSVAADMERTVGDDGIAMDDLGTKCIRECKGYETLLCCDPDSSRDLETICRASVSTCLQYFGQLFMNKRKVIVNALTKAVGSCCLESLLYNLRNYLVSDQFDEKHLDGICDLLAQLGEMILEQFDTLVASRHSTYIIRAFGRICCGLSRADRNRGDADGVPETKTKTSAAKNDGLKQRLLSSQQLKSNFVAITTRVLDWQSIHPYYGQMSISCLVQEFIQLESIASPITSGELVNNLLRCSLKSEFTETVFDQWSHKQASRVWESLLQHCADEEVIGNLYMTHLKGHLAELALHPFANFPLQRLLVRVADKETIRSMVDELQPLTGQLLTGKRSGVLVAIVAACAKNKQRQNTIRKELVTAVTGGPGKDGNAHFIRILIGCSSDETLISRAEDADQALFLSQGSVTTQGSVLLQHLLHFQKPTYFEKGLLNLSNDELTTLACHPAGSHVFDAFFASKTVSTQADLTNRLKDPAILVRLACDKYGSRVLETMWIQPGADTRMKTEIAKLLTTEKAMDALKRTPYGKILWTKYQLQKYKASPKEWLKFLDNAKEKKRLLTDLLK